MIIVEFDYYLGVFFSNEELVRFYIYILFWMFNVGDYGKVFMLLLLGED